MKKLPAFLLLALLSHPLAAQVSPAKSDSATDVPALAKQKFYKETASFIKPNELTHKVCYDEPGTVDESYCYTLAFHFADLEKLAPGAVIILSDTAVLKCGYGILSVWTWDYDSRAVLSGTVTVISKSRSEIVLEENVRVVDREGDVMVFRGRKVFVRKGN
jgi:hypothetical protein